MSTIRKQSIFSSVVVYVGFALGFVNSYLFTREGSGITPAQFGLVNAFIAIAAIMFAIANLGMPSFVTKFFPYYKTHLPAHRNDLLSIAFLTNLAGFGVVVIAGLLAKPVVIDKWFRNSPELPEYFYWTFVFGFGYTLFMLMEAYAWQQRKAVLSNFLREVLFRLITTGLIVLVTFGIIRSFDTFINIYSFSYLVLVLVLIGYFWKRRQFHFSLQVSKLTRRLRKKILQLAAFVWGGGLVFNVANVFDTIVIAAVLPDGLTYAGVYALAQNISSLIQAPQRAIISSAVGPLSEAWKEKDYRKINTIYHRSSINQLIFACFMFGLIWLNFADGVNTFHLKKEYLAAQWVFFFIGLYRIVDMGTGLNSQIISTSTYWRFEFISGVILFCIMLPLSWQLTRYLSIVGPAVSNLIAFTIYNGIRYTFLWRKFRMQPFTWKSLWTVLLGVVCYIITWKLFEEQSGFLAILLRSVVFGGLFAAGTLYLKLSPDILPVWQTIRKRLGLHAG